MIILLKNTILLFFISLVIPFAQTQVSADAKVAFIAGKGSHMDGEHEHRAGCMLLAEELTKNMPDYSAVVITEGWPKDQAVLKDVDALVIYCDGGSNNMIMKHLDFIDRLAKKGVGVICIHYAVDVPKDKAGGQMLDWLGGYFEAGWSVNPYWQADFINLPDHPIVNGVVPFSFDEEWYFHMRFRREMKGVTPILSAIPPERTAQRPDGSHSNNPTVRKEVAEKTPQHLAWASVNPSGSRGFGFTGGHFHENWADNNYRKVMLNAIVWASKGKVPHKGVPTPPLAKKQLESNLDAIGKHEQLTIRYPTKKKFSITSAR